MTAWADDGGPGYPAESMLTEMELDDLRCLAQLPMLARSMRAVCAKAAALLASLQGDGEARVSEDARDARRYRWLRACHWDTSKYAVLRHPKQNARLGAYLPSGERLDEVIDAALGVADQGPNIDLTRQG